jgi:hypothetical protein
MEEREKGMMIGRTNERNGRVFERGMGKIAVFWVVEAYRLVAFYGHFKGACCLHPQGDRLTELFKFVIVIFTVLFLYFYNNCFSRYRTLCS